MFRNRVYIFLGIIFSFAFLFFSYLVNQQVFTSFDISTTRYLQTIIPRSFDNFFSLLSLVGSFEVCVIFLIILFLIRQQFIRGLIVICLFGITHLFELYGKTFVRHPGPPAALLRYNFSFNFFSAYIRPGSSYPSGHAARALFITTVLGLLALKSKRLTNKHKVLIFLGLACYDMLMCISRVYLAEHWMSDVIGGALSGLGLSLFACLAI